MIDWPTLINGLRSEISSPINQSPITTGPVQSKPLQLDLIPDVLAEIWGWRPTTAQVSKWLRRAIDPIPSRRSRSGLIATESAVRLWAEDHAAAARRGPR